MVRARATSCTAVSVERSGRLSRSAFTSPFCRSISGTFGVLRHQPIVAWSFWVWRGESCQSAATYGGICWLSVSKNVLSIASQPAPERMPNSRDWVSEL